MKSNQTGSTAVHAAARDGDIEQLKELVEIMEDYVNKKDSNGWAPLHEGALSAHKQVIEILVETGADIYAQTNSEETPLWLAEHANEKKHPIIAFMKQIGAVKLGPQL